MLMKDKFSKFINLQGKYLTSLLILLALSIGNVWGADITWTCPSSTDAIVYQQTMSDGQSKFHNKNSASSTSTTTPEKKTNDVYGMKTTNSGGLWIIPNEAISKVTITYLCGSTNSSDISYKVQSSNYGNDLSSASTVTFAVKTNANKNVWYDAEFTIDVAKDKYLYIKFPTNVYISNVALSPKAVTNYTVTINPNGGSYASTPDGWTAGTGVYTKSVASGTALAIPEPSRENYDFNGWKSGTTSVTLSAGKLTVSKDTTLVAQWVAEAMKYSVTYNLNGPSGDAPTQASVAAGTEITLAAAPSWAGHAFDGWLCSADAAVKAAGASYTMTAANTTFTAQWHEVDCKIYSLTGGIGSAAIEADPSNAEVNANSLVLKGSNAIIKLTPGEGTFKAGDVLTISGTVGNTSKDFGVKISASNGKGSDLGTASVAGTTNPLIATATLSADADYLYICRTGGTTQTLKTVEVHRSCAAGEDAGLSYATAAVNKTEGEAKFTNPLTNANSLVLAGYKSSNAEVATVDFTTGEVTIVGPGSATISVGSAVQTKAGTLYAAGTASYALTVAALPKYTVTYDLNGGSGDPTEVDHKAGEKFNLHDGVTGITAPTNKTFVNWKDQDDAFFAGGAEYTMPAKNVTLTAQWAGDVYTVKFMDGEDVLDTKVVEVGEKPTDIEHPTKPLYTFAAWQKDAADIALDDAFWASVAKDAVVTLTVRWAKAYASNADFEAYILANTSEKDDSVKADTYVKSLNYALSVKKNTTFDANNSTNNGAYAGLKIKNEGTVLSWNVVAGKVVELKAGVMVANGSLSINGGAAATIDGGSTGSGDNFKNHYFYSAAEALYTFTTSNGSAEVVKAITMRDPYTVSFEAHGDADPSALQGLPSVTLPDASNGTASLLGWFDAETGGNKIGDAGDTYIPTANITLHAQWEAISTDNTLSDLKVGGVTVDGFSPAVHTYYVVLPYGTKPENIPAITATANSAKAKQVAIQQAVWTGEPYNCYRAQANVQAEDESWGYYDVRFSFAPKDGVSLIETKVTGQTTHGDVTGLIGGDAAVKVASNYKLNKGNYVGVTLAGSNKFQVGDVVVINVTNVENATGFTLYTTNDEDSVLIIDTRAGSLIAGGINKVTIPATYADGVTPYEGTSSIYLLRQNNDFTGNMNARVDSIAVLRAMNPVLKSIQFNSTDVAVTSTSVSATLPYGTNLGTMTVTPEIIWNGAAASNSILINGSATGAWAWGANTYKLTDKDGDATTYTITLTEADYYEAMIVGGASYATLVEAVAVAQANDVVKLLDNVDLMATGLEIASNITLDLNGFNIKAGEKLTNNINVPASVKLTLVDNSANAEGKIYTEEAYAGATTGYGVIRVSGEFLMQSGNIYTVIESDPANKGQFAVVIAAGGKVTVEGGQIKAGWYAISNNGNNTGSTIIVSGGELISTADYAIYNPEKESTVTVSGGVVYGAAGGIAMNRGELTVTGGTITSKDQGSTGTWGDGTGGLSNAAISASGKYESVEVEISGGTIIAEGTAVMITNGTTNPVEVAISGGQFSHVVPAEYCADGFAPVTEPNAQGKYEVEDKRIYIFDGSTMSNMATSPSGAISWAKVGDVMSATDKSGTYDEVNYTKALQLGNSTTTKHFKIDVALNNAAKIEVIGMSNSSSDTRHAWLTNSTDKGEIANAIASLATTGYNPEMFATDWLEEGSYYLHADNTVNIFLVRVTEKAVDPKCEQPTITAQPQTNITFGAGNLTATVVAEVSDEGTLTYQWYNAANDEAVVGQTTATLTTADEGTYYVIVTNTKASHRDNSIKSDNATLAHRVMNDATLSALSQGGNAIALEENKYEYRVDLAEGTTVVPALAATATMNPYANVQITDAAAFVDYEAISTVLVTAEDGTTQQTYTVHFYVDHLYTALVPVTGSTTWNWTGSEEATINDVANKGLILANYIDGLNFEKIEGKDGERARRNQNGGVYQGSYLHFNTTVYGKVKFYFRAPSGGENCTITVKSNGKEIEVGTRGNSLGWSREVVVYGDVVIEMENDKAGGGDTRVQQIVFTEITPDYTRNVSNNIGTLCVEHNVLAGGALGATFYQIVGRNQEYSYKIDFEEVLPGEILKAGYPYIFQSATGRIDLYYDGGEGVDEPIPYKGMYGNFAAGVLDITEENKSDILYIAQNKLWMCEDLVESDLILNEHRCYIKMSDVPEQTTAQSVVARRRLTISGDQAPTVITGVENLNVGDQPIKVMINGQMYILRGEKMYDATGRLVK